MRKIDIPEASKNCIDLSRATHARLDKAGVPRSRNGKQLYAAERVEILAQERDALRTACKEALRHLNIISEEREVEQKRARQMLRDALKVGDSK
jgi:hypothetical protein